MGHDGRLMAVPTPVWFVVLALLRSSFPLQHKTTAATKKQSRQQGGGGLGGVLCHRFLFFFFLVFSGSPEPPLFLSRGVCFPCHQLSGKG